jgi:hypothetical protein
VKKKGYVIQKSVFCKMNRTEKKEYKKPKAKEALRGTEVTRSSKKSRSLNFCLTYGIGKKS